jgi:hypothetical protein
MILLSRGLCDLRQLWQSKHFLIWLGGCLADDAAKASATICLSFTFGYCPTDAAKAAVTVSGMEVGGFFGGTLAGLMSDKWVLVFLFNCTFFMIARIFYWSWSHGNFSWSFISWSHGHYLMIARTFHCSFCSFVVLSACDQSGRFCWLYFLFFCNHVNSSNGVISWSTSQISKYSSCICRSGV